MFSRIWQGLLDIIYPNKCHACKNKIEAENSIDQLICLACWDKIKINLPPFCWQCGRRLQKKDFAKNTCSGCVRRRLHFDRAFSPCRYEGVMADLIHEFKYKGKDYLGRPLGKLMSNFIKEYDLPIKDIDLVMPIPLHKTRLREREFNQARLLGECIAEEFGKEMVSDCLIRERHTLSQTQIDPAQRLKNVQGSFAVRDGGLTKNKNILLIDDVLTTGATCSEAALALKSAGSGIIFVLTLAN